MKKLVGACLILACVVVFGFGQAEAAGPWYVQINEYVDCYTVYIDPSANNAAYGTIGYYPATFGGLYSVGSALGVGWDYLGSDYVTIIRVDGTESLCQSSGSSLNCFSNGTWTFATSCNPLAADGPRQVDD